VAIFVFGSNLAGRHGRGAALEARERHGAVYGKGIGHYGNSYAIPTKDANRELNVLPLAQISKYVNDFIAYAKQHPELSFNVTRIGCGLAGYSVHEIAPLFHAAPSNCNLPDDFLAVLKKPKNAEPLSRPVQTVVPQPLDCRSSPKRAKLF